VYEKGEIFKRGASPLSLFLPSPARKDFAFQCITGWRGVRGEVKPINQIQET